MKIVHVSPTYYSADSVVGGGEKYINYMCAALRHFAQGTGRQISQQSIAFGPAEAVYEMSEGVQGLVLIGEPWNHRSLNASAVRNALSQCDVVFVHQCLHPFGLFIAAQAKLLGKTVVGIDHGGGEYRLVYHTSEVGYVFDWFLAQSDFAATSFHDLDAQTHVIKGPIDTQVFKPARSSRDPNTIVMVGRVLPHKGHDMVVRCLPPSLKLRIIGSRYDEAYWNYLQELIGDRDVTIMEGLDDDQVLAELRKAALLIHPSTHWDYQNRHYPKPELLGLVPLEALACGTPVFVNNAGALPELANVDGCWSFSGDQQLVQMLHDFTNRRMAVPSPQEIHADVDSKYGLFQFGQKVVDLLEGHA